MLSNPSILVCTDFKAPSDYALKSAETIRKKVGGKIHVIHFSDIPAQWDWVAHETNLVLQNEQMSLDLLRSLRTLMAEQIKRCEVVCTSHVSLGPTYQGISETILNTKPDLVMMGHKGDTHGLFSLGGMVAKVVASSTVPVMVTKKPLISPLGKVAGLVDTNDLMTPIILATEEFSFLLSAEPEVISLWKNLSTQFHHLAPIEKDRPFLTVGQVEREFILHRMKEEISKALDQHSKCKIRVEITEERRVAYHLVNILLEEHVDLAIMKRHQKGLLEKMLIGSETRRLLEIFSGNVLVLPPSA